MSAGDLPHSGGKIGARLAVQVWVLACPQLAGGLMLVSNQVRQLSKVLGFMCVLRRSLPTPAAARPGGHNPVWPQPRPQAPDTCEGAGVWEQL